MVMQQRQMQPREGQLRGTGPLLRGQPRPHGNLSGPVARLVESFNLSDGEAWRLRGGWMQTAVCGAHDALGAAPHQSGLAISQFC